MMINCFNDKYYLSNDKYYDKYHALMIIDHDHAYNDY